MVPHRLNTLSHLCMKARSLILWVQGFLASVIDTSLESPNIENLFVVREFADVFPNELPGLPPAREIEFGIELIPGAEHISKTPYRMAPVELKELKEQVTGDVGYHPGKANVVADVLSQKSGMIACFDSIILCDLERLDVELCVRGSGAIGAIAMCSNDQKRHDAFWSGLLIGNQVSAHFFHISEDYDIKIRSLRSCFWIGLQRMLGGTGLVSTAFHSSKPLWSGVHRDTYEKLAVAKE
ncbi:hypothetical protein Tco_1391231 [Tanacetum coccineum]